MAPTLPTELLRDRIGRPGLAPVSVILSHRPEPADSLKSLIGFIRSAVEGA